MKKLIALIGILILMACSLEMPTESRKRPFEKRQIEQPERNERNSDAKDQIQKDRKD